MAKSKIVKSLCTLHFTFYILFWALISHPAFAEGNITKGAQKSPPAFIENKGQIIDQHYNLNPGVLYLLNTPGFNVQLRSGGFSYDVYRISNIPACRSGRDQRISKSEIDTTHQLTSSQVHQFNPPSGIRHPASEIEHPVSSIEYHRIDFDLLNANPDPVIETSDPSPDYFNYFTASSAAEGIKNVRQYAKITYKEIYPGIDLEFFVNEEHGYKYNFVIHPGGNINDIRLRITGPLNISFNKDSLKFSTGLGDVEELIPESYYIVNDSRVDIRTRFKRINDDVYGFASDKNNPENSVLIIDPTSIRLWGTYYGGNDWDAMAQCSSDKSGNVFLAGMAFSLNNIASAGSYQDTLAGWNDGFLAKFDAAGQRQWGTYFGGALGEVLFSCVVDKSGNVYVSGDTQSTSGIASPEAHQTVFGGGQGDCYIEKFNQAGDRLWGTYYGGAANDRAGVVIAGENGNVFLTGQTSSDTGIATPGSYQPNRNAHGDAFLAKFDSNGVRQWGTYYGGELDDDGAACSTDNSGNVYLAGETSSLTNIASPGAYQTTYGGDPNDAFLAKFTTGGQRIWATYYGGSNEDVGFGCTADSAGNVCLVGDTKSPNGIASTGSFQPSYGGGLYDGFIVKFDSSGQRLWGTYYGGTAEDEAYGCAIGWNGDIFFCGQTASLTGISTPDSYQPAYAGGDFDSFLVKFNAAGQRQWGTYYGGSGYDWFNNCRYVPDDTLYLPGITNSLNNISSQGAWQRTEGGNFDDMLIKFLECWPIDTAGPIAGPVNVCRLSAGVSFAIPSLAHAVNYVWTLPPGVTITSGAGTAGIITDISNSASSGTIWVKGLNKCGDPGDSAFLFVTVHQRPLPVISGNDTTCTGSGKVYSTAPGKSDYQWSVSPGGMITAGGTSADHSVTVTWNSTGLQTVQVNYTDTNGCAALMPTNFNVFVILGPPVSVNINASLNNICVGTPVTFTATSFNGGTNPGYQWKVNAVNAGTNSPAFTYNPASGDLVSCILTSNDTCSSNNPATSNTIQMVVNPLNPVSVIISTSANPVCLGTMVTYSATPMNGGTIPVYQWTVNGIIVGANNPVYSYVPVNEDVIICILTSNAVCASGNPATSNAVTMIVNPNLPVSVSINASANPVCTGMSVTFLASTINGGTNPVYQWKVNGVNIGTNSATYSYNPVTGDHVSCMVISDAICPVGNPATSNTITMNVATSPVVTFTLCNDSITNTNAQPFKLKGGIPLGGTYSGAGVSNGIFYPAIAGVGTHQINYTYTNAALCTVTDHRSLITINPAPFTCGNPVTDIRDNNIYPTVLIGSQCWMAANLNYGTLIPGNTSQRDNCIPEKYCPNDLTANCGLLTADYQWDELMQYDETISNQGLCPPGWHVPSEADWNTLFANYINNAFAASPLKYSGFSGFTALLSGARHLNKTWDFQGFTTFFWSSTSHGTNKAWAHGMNDVDPSVSAYPAFRSNAFSVRCIKD